MRKSKTLGLTAAGFCAGAVTGLFGAGGGMVLVPLLRSWAKVEDSRIFPSSVGIILPICITTVLCIRTTEDINSSIALPYLLGSGIGGLLAAKWGQKIPVKWLHRGLGILILWGGVRYLC